MAPTRIPAPASAALPDHLEPRKSPTQERARVLVSAVVEAASRVLAERGYAKFSMKRVAEVAGVGPGSLYQYFPDKRSLVAAVVEAQSERELAFHAERRARSSAGAGLFETIESMLRSVLEFQRAEGPLMRRLLESLAYLGRYPSLAAKVRDSAAIVRALLEEHRSEIAPLDLDLATHVLTNAIHSLTHDGVLPRPDTLDDETLLREAMRLVRGYLGAR